MNIFNNAVLDSFISYSREYSDMMNTATICESILLPTEEGFMEKIKKGFKTLYEKFHSLYMSFRKWVSSVINKIKSVFKKDKGTDSQKAKDTVNDIKDTMDKADEVDKKMKETSESDDDTVFESEDTQKLREDAEFVSKKMKDLMDSLDSPYTSIPETTEAGDKERSRKARYADYQEKGKYNLEESEKNDNKRYEDRAIFAFLDSNPFSINDYTNKNVALARDIVLNTEKIRNSSSMTFSTSKQLERTLSSIIRFIYNKEYYAAEKSFRYVSNKISSSIISKYASSHKRLYTEALNEIQSRKKEGLPKSSISGFYDDLFKYNPNMTTLSDAIDAHKLHYEDLLL